MKRNIILLALVSALVLSILPGCGNIGEDPLPFPGIQEDGSIALYRNGTLYNFDYTAAYDGIQLVEWTPPKQDGTGGAFTNMGSKTGGGYLPGSVKAIEFLHDLPLNAADGRTAETWIFTLFDTPPIPVKNIIDLSFQAKFTAPPEGVSVYSPAVTITLRSSSGFVVASKECSILMEERDAQWHEYRVPMNVLPDYISNDEILWQWDVSVPVNAGRIYVDEVIVHTK